MRHQKLFHRFFAIFSFLLLSTFISKAQVQTPRYNTAINSYVKGFYEYLPEGYSSGSASYPLIIFFHGAGERGDGSQQQLPLVLRNGIPKMINNGTFPKSFSVNGKTERFIIISPQFVDVPPAAAVNDIIDYAIQHYRVDVSRIYLTGLSMGGGMCFLYIGQNSTYAKRVAAMVPIAQAYGTDINIAKNVATSNLPVWLLHNLNDPTVSVYQTIDMVDKINSFSPAIPARKTIFQASGHDSWTKSYDPSYRENGLNVYEWMLQYSRGGSTSVPVANRPPSVNAGADKTVTLPLSSFNLSGSATDADGSIASYQWTKVSGPSQFSMNSTTIVNPAVSGLVEGTYVFRLTAKDNKGATASDDVTVTVNAAPVVQSYINIPSKIEAENYKAMAGIQTQGTSDAGGGQNVGWVDNGDWLDYNINVTTAGTYTVSLRVSSPNSGRQLQLRKQDGTVMATANVPQTGGWQTWTTITVPVSLQNGNQTIRVYASLGGWNINWLDFALSVSNQAPKVNAGADKTVTLPLSSFNLSGSATDADGSIASYQWTKVSGPSQFSMNSTTIVNPAVSGLVEGTYVFRLTAKDNKGATASDDVTVTVSKASASDVVAVGKSIKVNLYGGSNSYNNAQWNNWNLGTKEVTNASSGQLKYSDGSSSTVVAQLSHSQNVSDNGTNYGSGMAPAEVLRYASYSTVTRTLTLNGLSTSKTYSLELYASRGSSGNTTIFTANGSSVTIATYNNLTNKATFTNLKPNSNGQITVSIARGATYEYLNGFVLSENTMSTSSTTAVEEAITLSSSSSLQAYPNPFTDKLTLSVGATQKGQMLVQIVDMKGTVKKQYYLMKDNSTPTQVYLSASDLTAGEYVVRVQIGDWTESIKVVKQ